MKVKDILGKITKNKSNGQNNTFLKVKELKRLKMTADEFLDLKITLRRRK